MITRQGAECPKKHLGVLWEQGVKAWEGAQDVFTGFLKNPAKHKEAHPEKGMALSGIYRTFLPTRAWAHVAHGGPSPKIPTGLSVSLPNVSPLRGELHLSCELRYLQGPTGAWPKPLHEYLLLNESTGARMHPVAQNYGIHKVKGASRIVQIAGWEQSQSQSPGDLTLSLRGSAQSPRG